MNKHAQALGRAAKGKAKTMTDAAKAARRRNLIKGRDRLAIIRAERKGEK